MTLTAALNLALDPNTKEEGLAALAALSGSFESLEDGARPQLGASILRYGLGLNPLFAEVVPSIITHAVDFDMPCVALLDVVMPAQKSTDMLRVPKWTNAARSLAAWADGKVSA